MTLNWKRRVLSTLIYNKSLVLIRVLEIIWNANFQATMMKKMKIKKNQKVKMITKTVVRKTEKVSCNGKMMRRKSLSPF